MTVSVNRKKLSSKVMVSINEKNPSPTAGIKDSFRNTFPLDRKRRLPRQESLKKWFVLARKSVSATRNEAFVKKYASAIRRNYFFWQENEERKIKTMVLSKSIIGSHYKVLDFTWLLYYHFAEKRVTLRQGFYSKFFCFHVLGKSQLFLLYIRIVCTDS